MVVGPTPFLDAAVPPSCTSVGGRSKKRDSSSLLPFSMKPAKYEALGAELGGGSTPNTLPPVCWCVTVPAPSASLRTLLPWKSRDSCRRLPSVFTVAAAATPSPSWEEAALRPAESRDDLAKCWGACALVEDGPAAASWGCATTVELRPSRPTIPPAAARAPSARWLCCCPTGLGWSARLRRGRPETDRSATIYIELGGGDIGADARGGGGAEVARSTHRGGSQHYTEYVCVYVCHTRHLHEAPPFAVRLSEDQVSDCVVCTCAPSSTATPWSSEGFFFQEGCVLLTVGGHFAASCPLAFSPLPCMRTKGMPRGGFLPPFFGTTGVSNALATHYCQPAVRTELN